MLKASSQQLPLSIEPSQIWFGNDGQWNPFIIGVGSPPQWVHLLISTTSTLPWVVLSDGCPPDSENTACSTTRGGLFEKNQSSTWEDKGEYGLLYEQNLGIAGQGDVGLDNISLGFAGSHASNVSLKGQLVAGITTPNFWLATWGIRPAETNLTTIDNPFPSALFVLKEENIIQSLSWGYTAGAYWRSQESKTAISSLTFGGYDNARLQPHNTTFKFAVDTSRDLVVGIQAIEVDSQNLLAGCYVLSLY
jgi:hypothetical protein